MFAYKERGRKFDAYSIRNSKSMVSYFHICLSILGESTYINLILSHVEINVKYI